MQVYHKYVDILASGICLQQLWEGAWESAYLPTSKKCLRHVSALLGPTSSRGLHSIRSDSCWSGRGHGSTAW